MSSQLMRQYLDILAESQQPEQLDEGWKEALATAALATGMTLSGAGTAAVPSSPNITPFDADYPLSSLEVQFPGTSQAQQKLLQGATNTPNLDKAMAEVAGRMRAMGRSYAEKANYNVYKHDIDLITAAWRADGEANVKVVEKNFQNMTGIALKDVRTKLRQDPKFEKTPLYQGFVYALSKAYTSGANWQDIYDNLWIKAGLPVGKNPSGGRMLRLNGLNET
jgi:hypothetical protein